MWSSTSSYCAVLVFCAGGVPGAARVAEEGELIGAAVLFAENGKGVGSDTLSYSSQIENGPNGANGGGIRKKIKSLFGFVYKKDRIQGERMMCTERMLL